MRPLPSWYHSLPPPSQVPGSGTLVRYAVPLLNHPSLLGILWYDHTMSNNTMPLGMVETRSYRPRYEQFAYNDGIVENLLFFLVSF